MKENERDCREIIAEVISRQFFLFGYKLISAVYRKGGDYTVGIIADRRIFLLAFLGELDVSGMCRYDVIHFGGSVNQPPQFFIVWKV